ncbi:BRCA1-A complex subunit Abraxas 1 [Genypterus blacodes]|uniref:BRCA1-A complex subunit Abraxas 1 n=1 Tax=Genypterus blacodes TaxID=154954 RepID=UPI003F7766FE
MAEPTVRMSGIVLASLMFQHVNSDSDVEGLILGESKFQEQITISDSQADHIHIEEIYNVQKHVACHKLNNFYNGAGEVKLEAIKSILADNEQENVIGWYKQRRHTDQQMTFREKLIHENLKAALSNPHMIFVLLTPCKVTSPGSTHRMEYAAFISRSRHFLNVPVLVNNLGLLEQFAYWKVSAPCSAAGYNLTMKKHGLRFFSSNGSLKEVNEVDKMNESLQSELEKSCKDVEESERLVEALMAEVSALRKRISEKKRNASGTDEPPPEPNTNVLLQEAIRVLFACSPLFQTQTLTLEAFPVPGCAEQTQDIVTAQPNPDMTETDGLLSQLPLSKKRLKDKQLGRERKWKKESPS